MSVSQTHAPHMRLFLKFYALDMEIFTL